MCEQEGKVDLATAGFVAAGVVGDLHVADAGQAACDRCRQLALNTLNIIKMDFTYTTKRSQIMKSLALKISMAVLSMIARVAKAELIVLASPQSNDAYYAKMIDDIFDFHVDYAKKLLKMETMSLF